jgi:hypothetical protein
MTHKERKAEADRLMAILQGKGDSTLITETGELHTSVMTPYAGLCLTCGETSAFEHPPELWQTKAGDYLRALTPEQRLHVMREMFQQMPCLGCGGRGLVLQELAQA